MTMKNLIKSMLMLSLLIVSPVAFGQQPMQQRPPEERAQRQTQWLQQNVALTDDQNKKVYDIILQSAKQADAARNSGGDVKSQMKDINTSRDAAIKGVLTDDQYQKYQQHVQEMQQQRKSGGGMQGGGQN